MKIGYEKLMEAIDRLEVLITVSISFTVFPTYKFHSNVSGLTFLKM
jgi:hypothetical protein